MIQGADEFNRSQTFHVSIGPHGEVDAASLALGRWDLFRRPGGTEPLVSIEHCSAETQVVRLAGRVGLIVRVPIPHQFSSGVYSLGAEADGQRFTQSVYFDSEREYVMLNDDTSLALGDEPNFQLQELGDGEECNAEFEVPGLRIGATCVVSLANLENRIVLAEAVFTAGGDPVTLEVDWAAYADALASDSD